jgi:hypothetical protein
MAAMRRPALLLLLICAFFSACRRAPSAEEAEGLLRASNPALDTATVVVRVWADGPPWFSCAEVIAKFRAAADSQVVRSQVGNWRALVLADWVSLRDTTHGHVVEPGWCAATLRDSTARLSGGWAPVRGDSLPTGTFRRGWDVPAGRQKVVVHDAPEAVGKDSVRVNYVLTVAPNQNGVALQSDRDSTRHQALLTREDGRWRVHDSRWTPPPTLTK